jgi:hypothetical protein
VPPEPRLRHQRGQLVEDLIVFGEPAGLMLTVDQSAIHLYIEDPAAALDQFRLDAVLLLDRSRQTGSLGQVVSFDAVGDGDSHRGPPFFAADGSQRAKHITKARPGRQTAPGGRRRALALTQEHARLDVGQS